MTPTTPTASLTRGERLQAFFEVQNLEYAMCLAVPKCPQPAIRAHSVQNARVLDLLCVDNHVYVPEVKVHKDTGPFLTFSRRGRNLATTFAGMCSEHDSRLFAPLDNEELDPQSALHCNLLAWRAAFFESHAAQAVGLKSQVAYQKRVEMGLDAPDVPSPAGLVAVGKMLEAWKVFRWRADLDIAFHTGASLDLCHESIILDTEQPTVAVSSLFVVGVRKNANDLRCVTLNVLPLSATKTWALFSFKRQDKREVHKAVRRVLAAPSHNQKYQLSRLILQRCQNFVLSPSYFETWPEPRRRVVLEFFERTMFETEIGFDSPDLQLLT